MHRLVAVAFCFVGALANTEGGIKNATAGGHYGGNVGYDPSTSYNGPSYENYGGYGMYGYPLLPPVMERNVCDLDASILLVTEPSRHGHSRAVRVRCSEIANHDENSCSVCCQNSARRDKAIKKEDMFGFLAVTEDFEKNNSEEDDDNDRVKRSAGFSNTGEADANLVHQVEWKASAHYTNVKCVCCSPTRPLPPRPAYPSPLYQAPQQVYQPPAQAQPQSIYQTPAQSQPVYQTPAQSQSAYQAPAQAQPAYQTPAQAQPIYQAPVHPQPNYQVPAQSSPKPYQPVVQSPGNQQAAQQY